MSHDIGIACRRSSEWPGRRQARPCRTLSLEASPGHHRRPRRSSSQSEVARTYGVSQGWISRLMARYAGRGRGRVRAPLPGPEDHPRPPPHQATVELVLRAAQASSPRPAWTPARTPSAGTCQHHHQITLSRATINRILVRAGQVTPDPSKRPKSLLHPLRGRAAQRDLAVRLHPLPAHPPRRHAPAPTREIITWLDDHSRYALHVSAHARVTAPIVLATFRTAADLHGYPASTLTDNGMVYTVRLAGIGRRGGTNAFEARATPPRHRARRTPDPTTPPPAARSNGSSRR